MVQNEKKLISLDRFHYNHSEILKVGGWWGAIWNYQLYKYHKLQIDLIAALQNSSEWGKKTFYGGFPPAYNPAKYSVLNKT